MGTLIRPSSSSSSKQWPSQPKPLVDSTNRQLNHSPVDSPPTVKKKLCRLAKGLFVATGSSSAVHRGTLDSLDAAFVSDAPAVELAQIALGTVPASSLRRLERCNSLTTKGASILKKGKLLRASIRAKSHSWPPRRGVQFHDDVTVIRINDAGQYVCTECEKLQVPPPSGNSVRDRQQSLYCRGPQRSVPRSQSPPAVREPNAAQVSSLPSGTCISPAQRQSERPVPWSPDQQAQLRNPAACSSTSTASNGINFSFVEDPHHGLKLKFSVPLGSGYGPSDIVVKANMSGNRIRVVASRSSANGFHRSSFEQFNERYPLPMDVDPYMVTARLDVKGQLIVEAPLMTLARRNSFDNGRQKTAQAAEQVFGAV